MSSSHRELVAWQRAMDLAHEIHVATRSFPKSEIYGLVSQLRRAAVAIPSNIAEGHGRGSAPEFARFLGIARGSLREVETQLELAHRFGYLPATAFSALIEHANATGRVLTGLITSKRLVGASL